eukprot:CAMPEP_0117010618 /NCGR_PEP_ID=MMETSP0472-20121206/9315_1 /TAXON_ID=693140 ORGANISM="Tiarina fusus, Strain LIS" /NCGR_SAMPLE_ID=MMETSP0472 /ASSEMBLY_ACC=CAM_ASM_000603 /LENGTH=74 /DNA_ID=CAMNT_0004713201 /DNA_START=195 /DNA_END=419 /DNA_ORIENTATION=+
MSVLFQPKKDELFLPGCLTTWSRSVVGALNISSSLAILLAGNMGRIAMSFMAAMANKCSSISDDTSGSTKHDIS